MVATEIKDKGLNMKFSIFRVKPRLYLTLGFIALLICITWFVYTQKISCGRSYLTDSSVHHLFEYCNSPYIEKLEQEGTVPSTHYKLESVHVVIRHGDRTNLHSIPKYKDIDISCDIFKYPDLISHIPQLKTYHEFMLQQPTRKKEQSFSGWDLHPNKEKCQPSELTPTGAAQHLHNGLHMKKRYIDNLNLLDKRYEIFEQVLIRSTSYSRTFQSAMALMYGLLGNDIVVTDLNIEEAENCAVCLENKESLPCDCPYVRPYIDTMSATFHQMHPEVMDSKKTQNVLKHYSNIFDIPQFEVPRIGALMDINMIHICNKETLPGPFYSKNNQLEKTQCVDPWSVRDTYDIIQSNGKQQMKTTTFQKIAKLKFLPLLDEIKDRMLQQFKGETPIKFVLYSGHDTTINPLAIALNFSNGHWSPFASKIVMELYSSKNQELYVRILFNGKVVTTDIEYCKKHIHTDGVGYETGLCPFPIFEKYINHELLNSISETSYETACISTIE